MKSEAIARHQQIGACSNLPGTRGLSESTKELIGYAGQLLVVDHPQTLRQLHYAIFSRGEIDYTNDKPSYARLSRATTTARRAYREWQLAGEVGQEPAVSIPPTWMVDEGRQPETVNVWQDAAGDHDPSGHAIESDIHQRVQTASGRGFTMERLAIHPADIEKFNLPPQKIKATDSRSAGFRREYGSDAATVELDALPAAELRRRIEEAVTSLIDFDVWSRQEAVQQVEFASIALFAEQIKALPQLGGAR